MDWTCLLLAQNEVLERADQTITTFDKLAKAGPVTLSLVIAFGAVAFGIWQMLQNKTLREQHVNELLNREKESKADAAKQLQAVLDAAKERREAEKDLLREMVLKGDDAVEALEASTAASIEHSKAIENIARSTGDGIKDVIKMLTDVQRSLDLATRAVDDLRRRA